MDIITVYETVVLGSNPSFGARVLLNKFAQFIKGRAGATAREICRCSPLGRAARCLRDIGGFDSHHRRQLCSYRLEG